MPLTFGSLFAGIGGFDLGLERSGMICEWQVEIDPYATKVLTRHWPDVQRYPDIRLCGRHNLRQVDVICGGFPCQDISNAGKRAGIDGERSGLWSEFHRIICELRPRYVIVENVAALLVRGIDRVLGDLASCGYDAEWRVFSAREFGALHLRERLLIVAYPNGERQPQSQGIKPNERRWFHNGIKARNHYSNLRQERIQRVFKGEISRVSAFSWCENVRRVEDLRNRPDIPEPLFRGSRDGIPSWMDRVSATGNAVVPQIAQWIGERIVEADNEL